MDSLYEVSLREQDDSLIIGTCNSYERGGKRIKNAPLAVKGCDPAR